MGKQTMGVPLHALNHRSDNKLYRLQTAQSPLVRPYLHDDLDIDNYPLGTNAIVAVLSYTVRLVFEYGIIAWQFACCFCYRLSTGVGERYLSVHMAFAVYCCDRCQEEHLVCKN